MLNNLSVKPPPRAVDTLFLIPSRKRKSVDAAAPFSDLRGDMVARHVHVDAGRVAEQFGRVGPFVGFELPCLARGENGDEALPVVWFEVGGAVGENEAGWFAGCVAAAAAASSRSGSAAAALSRAAAGGVAAETDLTSDKL